ncbi:MAG: hypothetical protein AB8G22_19220 [Saprospiraceae bacterium]
MTDQRFLFWQKWLTYANVFALIIGLLAAFAIDSFVFDVYNQNIQIQYADGQPLDPQMNLMKKWLFGIIGGTIAGFQLLIIFISENAFRKRERWAWVAVFSGMLMWFVVDSTACICYGAWFNVWLINIPSFILILIPLIATRKVFLSANDF